MPDTLTPPGEIKMNQPCLVSPHCKPFYWNSSMPKCASLLLLSSYVRILLKRLCKIWCIPTRDDPNIGTREQKDKEEPKKVSRRCSGLYNKALEPYRNERKHMDLQENPKEDKDWGKNIDLEGLPAGTLAQGFPIENQGCALRLKRQRGRATVSHIQELEYGTSSASNAGTSCEWWGPQPWRPHTLLLFTNSESLGNLF